jgi:hypothetical protein
MAEHPSFYCDDAFAYVKAYQELVMKNQQQINDLKEEFEKRYWDGTQEDSFYFVKLRAYEHALEYKESGKPPAGMVIIGGGGDGGTISAEQQKLNEVEAKYKQCKENMAELEGVVKDGGQRELGLKSELLSKEQETRILKRKLNDTQSTYAIVGAAIFAVGVMMLWVLI